MGWKTFLGSVFFLFVIISIGVYWFFPFDEIDFVKSNGNTNFTLPDSTSNKMQFYENMRFPEPKISYKIDNCPIKRKYDMIEAFSILSNKTILNFYEVASNEEITVYCEEQQKYSEGLFIAGEGGPTNITSSGEFNTITHGKILLLKDSDCTSPNIAIHELLHVLGFEHSQNKNNILYNISKCDQEISTDIIELLNKLYSINSYADLALEDVTAKMNGRYLDTNVSVRNNGFKDSEKAKLFIYADGELIKEMEIMPLSTGYGRIFTFSNILINQFDVKELEYSIDADFSELDKKNNKIKLEIK